VQYRDQLQFWLLCLVLFHWLQHDYLPLLDMYYYVVHQWKALVKPKIWASLPEFCHQNMIYATRSTEIWYQNRRTGSEQVQNVLSISAPSPPPFFAFFAGIAPKSTSVPVSPTFVLWSQVFPGSVGIRKTLKAVTSESEVIAEVPLAIPIMQAVQDSWMGLVTRRAVGMLVLVIIT
jgi:hypothetical protein